MKAHPCLPFLAAALLIAVPGRAETKATPGAEDNRPVLHVTVMETVAYTSGNSYTDFDRLDVALTAMAKQRNWPVRVKAERLLGDAVTSYNPELRIVLQAVSHELGDEYLFRATVFVLANGKETNLGLVTYRHAARLGENLDTLYEKIFRGGAGAIADKAQPLLFPEPVLHVSVIDSVNFNGSANAYTDFDRLDVALTRVAEKRKWPVKLDVSRLAGNTPDYPTELRITIQRVSREPIQDYVIRAWVTLQLDGKKQDFGIVSGRYSARLGENFDDTYEKVFLAEAQAIADKVEPLLFPGLKKDERKK